VGDQGRIEWNNVENTLHLHQPEQHSPEVIRFDSLERNDLFIAQQKNFLDSITGKTTLVSPLSDSTHTLRVCLAARESIAARQPVTLEP
jgi:predicted dehydrogenase